VWRATSDNGLELGGVANIVIFIVVGGIAAGLWASENKLVWGIGLAVALAWGAFEMYSVRLLDIQIVEDELNGTSI
jgi:hypothetical protein